jgi:hypothetical protein
MRPSILLRVAVLSAVLALAAAAPAARAQAPLPPPGAVPEASDIASCLCLGRSVNALNAEMSRQRGAYDAHQAELARLDAQLQSARETLDVNNPEAVAEFRALLARRDAAFRRGTSLAAGGLTSVTQRYNASVGEYNGRCANRPRDPVVLRNVEATLVCPPAY